MKALLVAVNAKFIHSCPAVSLLAAYAKTRCTAILCETAEYTINQNEDGILGDIFRRKPDLIGFSCYIWNMDIVLRLAKACKQILPEVPLLFGGPEVSYDPGAVLAATGGDFVIRGEGERPFTYLLQALSVEKELYVGKELYDVPSLSWRQGDSIVHNPSDTPFDLGELPFLYETVDEYENRIIYYEAQRGCPFNCQYCLSSTDKGVRFAPLEKVKRELLHLLSLRVRQVKFVDRTFNSNPSFAIEIWQFLIEHDNGVTNFHFEMEANLIKEEMYLLLQKARPGLFQFEIGVQTTNPETLAAICRTTDFTRLSKTVERLQKSGNIHLHLDLIAGLPHENFARFGQSFDQVYALAPDQLQLGFLKLLKGSGLRENASQYGIVYREEPPYEVLSTHALPYEKLLELKEIEALVDRYYNSCRYRASLAYLVKLTDSPFGFYRGFVAFLKQEGDFDRPRSKLEQLDLLYRFGCTLPACDKQHLQWLLKFDACGGEKPKKLPDWMPDITLPRREEIYAFFREDANISRYLSGYEGLDTKLIYKTAHIEVFPFDPRTGEAAPVILAFNYKKADILGNAATISLPI